MRSLKALPLIAVILIQGCGASNPLTNSNGRGHNPYHLDLEASSAEVAAIAEASGVNAVEAFTPEDKKLAEIINVGKRNLEWFKLIAKNQPAGHPPLSISRPSLKGIPMDDPKRYNGKTIIADYELIVSEVPAAMKAVLIDQGALTNSPPVDLDEYLKWAEKFDRQYDVALRWRMMQPYLSQMASLRRYDIRGYYFLKQRPNLKAELEGWSKLAVEDQTKLRQWLDQQCFNTSGNEEKCNAEFEEALAENKLWDMYQEKAERASNVYNEYFVIYDTRPEAVWNSKNPDLMTVPFKIPGNLKVQEALRANIQDEWKWNTWKLELLFKANAPVHVVFEPEATPNVNGTGGDTITMDANTPLEEESTKYALRHEFGHVLGFPDCYLEFYDENEKIIVSYQIDTSDIMCSRAGKFKEHHYEDLKKAYFDVAP